MTIARTISIRSLCLPRQLAPISLSATAGAVFAVLLTIAPAVHAQAEFAPGAAGAQVVDDTQPPLSLPTADEINKLADNLDHIKDVLDVAKPFNDKDFDRLDDVVDYSQKFAALSAAIKQDAEEKRDFFSNSSHTMQDIAKLELGVYTDIDRLQDLAKVGLISQAAARRFGYLSFGAGDVAEGLGTMAGPHSLGNVDAVEKFFDGINATAWGVYGFALTKNWDVAQAYAAAGRLTVKGARDLTLPMVERITAHLSGFDGQFVAIWEQAQKDRVRVGESAETIEEFYHRDASILDKIAPDKLSEANARLGLDTQFVRRTVEHYRETCINGYCSRIDLLPPPATPGEHPLGGVQLDQPLTGAALRGVRIDQVNGNIVLLGERDFLARGLNLRDFAMALWLVFGEHPQDPAFSLDPDDVRNPRGSWLRARYMPDLLQGRSFGAEMFAADLVLKELSFQVMRDPNGKLMEWKSTVPGFHSYAELAIADSGANAGEEQWSRFWIVAQQVTARHAGNTLLFDAKMAVKVRRQTPDPNSPTGLRDVETDPKSLEAQWAQLATTNYDELAVESPAFARVREMAVAVAIAKSLKAAGAQIDLERVADILNADHTPTVRKINAFSVGWQRRSQMPFREDDQRGVRIQTEELRLFGGVDLAVEPHDTPDDEGVARGMDKTLETAFHLAGPGTDIVRFEYGSSKLEAVALPLLVKQSDAKP